MQKLCRTATHYGNAADDRMTVRVAQDRRTHPQTERTLFPMRRRRTREHTTPSSLVYDRLLMPEEPRMSPVFPTLRGTTCSTFSASTRAYSSQAKVLYSVPHMSRPNLRAGRAKNGNVVASEINQIMICIAVNGENAPSPSTTRTNTASTSSTEYPSND